MKRILFAMPLLLLLAGCSRQIESGMSETEAQDVVVLLREYRINASLESDGVSKKDGALFRVTVCCGSEKEFAALKILRQHGLPRPKVSSTQDIVADKGLVTSPTEERARLMVGLAGDLSRHLSRVPGIIEASVQPVLPDNNPLVDKQDQSAATASVLIRYRGDKSPLTDAEIRDLVSKGVQGLRPENISVVQKQTIEESFPPENVGPLNVGEWAAAAALGLSGITGVGALTLLAVSKQRGYRIKMLERQVAQLTENNGGRLPGNA